MMAASYIPNGRYVNGKRKNRGIPSIRSAYKPDELFGSREFFQAGEIFQSFLPVASAHLSVGTKPGADIRIFITAVDAASQPFIEIHAGNSGRFALRHAGNGGRYGDGDAAGAAARSALHGFGHQKIP
jgi:hypothetical protein